MTSAYEIINGTPLTDKMRERVKHYRYKYSEYSRLKEIEMEIMFNSSFSFEENVRIFFEVGAYLFSIEQAERAVEEICRNAEHYLDSSLPAGRHSE